jgi:hypothetical protein
MSSILCVKDKNMITAPPYYVGNMKMFLKGSREMANRNHRRQAFFKNVEA